MKFTIGVAGILGICAWMDCRWQKIWMPFTGLLFAYILFFRIKGGGAIWESAAAAILTIILFYVMSVLTEGQIGKADGVILGEIMLAFGVWEGVGFLMYCMMYAFAAALVLTVAFRKKKETRMPFVPFIFLGYLTTVMTL